MLRTLSKAWALAGARLGVALAHEAVATLLQRVRAPYPISTPQIEAGLRATTPAAESEMRRRVASVRVRRAALVEALLRRDDVMAVWPSVTNFVLVRWTEAGHQRALERTRAAGIVLRDRSAEPGLTGCIRITIGSEEETARLLAVLA